MKLSITDAGSAKLEELMSKVQTINSFALKSLSALTEAIILEVAEKTEPSQLESIAMRLTSPKGKQLALVKTLRSITENADDETLRALEKTFRKISQNAAKT